MLFCAKRALMLQINLSKKISIHLTKIQFQRINLTKNYIKYEIRLRIKFSTKVNLSHFLTLMTLTQIN